MSRQRYDKVPPRTLRSFGARSHLHIGTHGRASRWVIATREGNHYRVEMTDLCTGAFTTTFAPSRRIAAVIAKRFAREEA